MGHATRHMRAEAPHVRRTPNKRVQVPMHGMGIVAPMAIYPQDDSIPKMTNFGMSLLKLIMARVPIYPT